MAARKEPVAIPHVVGKGLQLAQFSRVLYNRESPLAQSEACPYRIQPSKTCHKIRYGIT